MSYFKWLYSNWKYWKHFKSFPKDFQLLQKWPSETYLKYPPTFGFNGQKVLNFGCGTSVYRFPNVINADVVEGDGVNLILTENKLPLEDNSIDFILANHVMEHVPNWFETMKEFARVLKPGGTVEIWIPPISSDSAFSYRDHINRIGFESFAGCKTLRRSGVNLAARKEFDEIGDFSKLYLTWRGRRTKMVWWLLFLPEWFVNWACEYLRNTVSEEGYRFKKDAN